jgi:hypothetical protein
LRTLGLPRFRESCLRSSARRIFRNFTVERVSALRTAGARTLSQRTVETYLASAAKKLHAVNRVQLIAEALRRGPIVRPADIP